MGISHNSSETSSTATSNNNWNTFLSGFTNNPSKRLILEIILAVVLVLAIGLPRLPDLNTFVTTDERLWLERSGWFYYALSHKDYKTTFQKSHPGVTVMWAGLTSYLQEYPAYNQNYDGQDRPVGINTLERRDFSIPMQLLYRARQAVVIIHMVILGLSFLFACQLFGIIPSLVGFLLIAFDPFHIALSRVLHLDSLLGDFMLLSLLAFLAYLNNRKTASLIISAIAAGLAWLTKSPGLFLIPLIGLLMLFDQLRSKENWTKNQWGKTVLQIAKVVAIWGVIGLVVFYIAFPAMWVDPIGSIARILGDAVGYAEAGHESAVFFNGHIYPNGEIPGISFYPVNFLWRTTPITLLGLLAAVIVLVQKIIALRKEDKSISSENSSNENLFLSGIKNPIWNIAALIFFALGFAALMSMGLKKFDRYIIPSFTPLDLVAGVGLVWLVVWIGKLLKGNWKNILPAGLLLIFIAVQAILAFKEFPYYFTYYNPLLGGSLQAPKVMQIGWGEGLDQAATYLNNKPNAKDLRVISWYGDGSFSYLCKGDVSPLIYDHAWLPEDWRQFYKSDYIVVYIHEWQRNLPPEALNILKDQKPEYSVWIDGLEYVRVYKTPPEPQ